MKGITLFIVFMLLIGAQIGVAQELPPLSEQYTSDDGRLIVQYPSDWVVLKDGEVIVLTHASAMKAVRNGAPIPDNYLAATIVLPTQLTQVGLTAALSAEDVVERFIELSRFDAVTEIEPYSGVGIPGASAIVSNLDMHFGQLIALEFDSGTVLVAVEFANDYDAFPDQYAAILAYGLGGLIYDGQSAADGSVMPGGMAQASDSEVVRQWAMFATGSSQFGQSGWGFGQATGAPNTEACGDTSTAWASSNSRGVDNLTLGFSQAVIPTQVNIYQTFTPGSIIRIELINTETGDTIEIPDSADPPGNTPCPGVFSVNIEAVNIAMNGVVIYFDQTIGGSWNEIDAVELVGKAVPVSVTQDIRQWANYATGSSQYGEIGWGFMQATGAPDTDTCGDSLQAWAASGSTTSEILALEFEQAVIPTQVNIYQTYNPGSIIRIELTNTDTGEIIPLPNSADPPGNTPCPGVFRVDVSRVETLVNGVIIYFDQSIGGSWNEIDAVELVGKVEGSDTGNSSTETSGLAIDVDSLTFITGDYQGQFTIDYPITWAIDFESRTAALASSETVLNIGVEDDPGTEIAIQIVSPDMLLQLGVEENATTVEALEALAAPFGSNAPIETYEGVKFPAAYSQLNGADAPPGSHLIAVGTAVGVYALALRTHEFEAYAPVINHMIDSMTFGSTEDNGEATNSSGAWEVTESFSHEGNNTLSLYYPVGWITDTSALPAIASSSDALAALQRGAPMPEGEIAIGIIPAADVTDVLGIPSSDSAEEMITSLAQVFGGETEIVPFDGLIYPAYYTPLVGTTRLPENSQLLAFEHSNGVVTFLIVTDVFDSYVPLLMGMIESLSLE